MSIDREINSRVDAFGSNPQALQKRYAATKQLVDLLALQRIKSQKDDVARQIQMEMQSNPATIKQQREQELFGRTAQDVAQQVGGAIQNRQRQQKQGMQRMAQRAAPSQGLGALQQPKRMQAGGIVAFDGGGAVETLFGEQGAILPLGLDKKSSIRDRIQYAIDTNKPLSGFSVEELKALQSDDNQYTPKIEAELARRQPEPKTEDTPPPVEPKPPTSDQTGGIAPVDEPKIPTAENALVLRDQGNQGIASIKPPSLPPAPAPEEYDLQAGLEAVGDAPAPAKVDRTGLEERGVDLTKAYGVDPASIDPKAEGLAALQSAEDYYGIKDKDTEARQGLADLAAIDAAQTDPDKLRRERMKAFLLGAAGRGSTALAASGAASANLGRAQERDVRARQIKRNEMLKQIQNQDTEVRKLAKSEERSAMERADQLKMDGLRIISNMSNAELSARQTEARNITEANIANYNGRMKQVELMLDESNNRIDQTIEQAKLASADANRRGQIANAGIEDIMRRLSDIDQGITEIYQTQEAADPVLQKLTLDLAEAADDGDSALVNDIQLKIDERRSLLYASVTTLNEAIENEKSELKDKIIELENIRDGAMGGNYQLSPEQERLVQSNN